MFLKQLKPILSALVFISALVLSGCNSDALKIHESGLKYKILRESSDTSQARLGDVLALRYRILDEQGKVFEESPLFRIQLKKPSHEGGSVEDGLSMLHKGDSAMFLINAGDYFQNTRQIDLPESILESSFIQFHVKLVDIIDAEEIKLEQEAALISGERNEEQILKLYLKQNNIDTEPQISGLVIIPLKEGKGDYPTPGKNVTVHYVGSFLDGKAFDSSYDRNEPFVFPLAIGQVIQGWDEGISKMKIGGKYRLIIPSYLAYGEKQIGPIPPFSTLVFDVELISQDK